jgi:hypothetical protein
VFAFGSLLVVWLISLRLGFGLMQWAIVSLACGADRYAAGVRVAGKPSFHLSDGTALGYGWQWAYVLGVFACNVLITAPYVRLLQKLGLLRGDEAPQAEKSQQEP